MDILLWCDSRREQNYLLTAPGHTKNGLMAAFYLSGSRESNPDHSVPNRVHYHYATPRLRR